jgi:hypothetical protein
MATVDTIAVFGSSMNIAFFWLPYSDVMQYGGGCDIL